MTSETQNKLPAGWYTDPGETGGKRWWDGTKWTEHLKMPEVTRRPTAPSQSNPYGIGTVHLTGTGPIDVADPTDSVAIDSRGPLNNRAAWLSLLAGLVAVALTLAGSLPGSTLYWVGGAAGLALVLAVVALAERVAGTASNVIAPVFGVVLGTAGILLVVMGISVLGVVTSATSALFPPSSGSAALQTASATTSTEPLVFPSNSELTSDGTIVQQLATAMNTTYAGGNPSLGAGESWPARITFTPTTVLAADGKTVLATIPSGHLLSYKRSADSRSYQFSVAGTNSSEIASYNSATNRFSFSCASTDPNCVPTR
jgi:hypothetical protein